jgi:hypothetical protein
MHDQTQAAPAIPAGETKLEVLTDDDRRRRDEVNELQKAMPENQVRPMAVALLSARGPEYSALND